MLGNDARSMADEILGIIANKEVIAVNQDSLGRQGKKVKDAGDLEVWSKELSDGSRTVVMFNRSGAEAEISFTWVETGLLQNLNLSVRDLWQHQGLEKFTGSYSAIVPSHGVVMVKVY